MKCPYCLEEIIDGALVCRFCGKKQPPMPEAKKRAKARRGPIILFSVLGAIGLFFVYSVLLYQGEKTKLQAAAACNGTMTASQLMAMAEEGAKKNGISVDESVNLVAGLACPAMMK